MAVQFFPGDVKVDSVERALTRQLGQFRDNVQRFARKTLLDAGKLIRKRMVEERLSGIKYARGKAPKDAPLAKKTGALIRSLRYTVKTQGSQVRLVSAIGSPKVYYAGRYEEEGRLQFGRIAKEVIARAQDELRIGFGFLARSPAAAGALSLESTAIEPVMSALEGELRAAWQGRGESLRRAREERSYRRRFREIRARERARQRARGSGRRAFRSITSGFGRFGLGAA
jgi:hypothetical protein